MAINFPGPDEVEINYTCFNLDHSMRLNCKVVGTPIVGQDPTTIEVLQRSGFPLALDVAVDLFVEKLLPLFAPDATFNDYNLYQYTEGTFDKTYITTGSLAEDGTAAGVTQLAHQNTVTFRTQEGNGMKIVLLESESTNQLKLPYATVGTTYKNLMDYLTGTTNWILARDTSYPVVPLNVVGGQNEKLFRIRYR